MERISEVSQTVKLMESFWSFYSKQMDTKKDVDLSSFLLVEASGDSESDFDPNSAIKDHVDDDAQSCSCDVSDYYSRVTEVQQESVHEVDDHHKEVGMGKEQEDEVHGYQEWANGLTVNQKSCVSVESTNESMNEMEKNRLFWETCLAS